jgi:CHAD domain-containing protein
VSRRGGAAAPGLRGGEETAWTASDDRTIGAALKALRADYRLVTRRRADVRRTWLDTADWRLHRAGLTLSAARDDTGDVLYLTGPAPEQPLAAPDLPGAPGWPRLLGGLPDGLRDRLAGVLDIRALLPVAQVRGAIVTGAVLDGEGRTVLRFEHARPARFEGQLNGTAALPGRLTLTPQRGHRAEAARATRSLRAQGLTRDQRSAYEVMLATAGIVPGDGRRPALQPGLPASVAVAGVLLGFLDDLENTLEGTIADVDTEFLHDLRVAVRRSRSAVKLLAGALPPELVSWAAPHLKWLGDLTTPVRDLDVHLLGLPVVAARLRGGRPEDLQPLADYLATVRAGERHALVRGLRSARFTRFQTRWRSGLVALAGPDGNPGDAAAAGPADAERTAGGEPTAAGFGLERVARAHRRVLGPGARITPASPPEALHDLRKRGKELRYLLEIFSDLLPPHARGLVKELKGLQDVLGTFQDSEVQRAALATHAEAMLAAGAAPAATLMAMGEIAAQLHDDQLAARAEFDRRFTRFADASRTAGLG